MTTKKKPATGPSASTNEKLTFAFDVGTGSLGCAVRLGNEIVHTRVYLFDPEFASTKRVAEKRRLYRTRLAHRAREFLLNQICEQAGVPVLKKIEATNGDYRVIETDPRLKREFPAPGDETVYNSALLRIQLIEGEKLEPWQIYKALHSAIQRRGYGRVPWAQNSVKTAKQEAAALEKEEEENHARSARFDQTVRQMSDNPKQHLIPYFVAHRMGLWDPKKGIVKVRVDQEAKRASLLEDIQYQGITASRETVEHELKLLLTAAKKKFPKLDVEAALYGLHRKKIDNVRTLDQATRLAYTRTWQGLLAQKIPRFDNRILASCALIPRMHVARTNYEANPLHSEIHLLLALHRLRPLELRTLTSRPLKPAELKKIFDDHLASKKNEKPTFKFTPTQLERALKEFGLVAAPNAKEIPEPKDGGRSRFSRPGAYFLKKLILSGQKPAEFYQATLQNPCAPKSKVTIQDNRDPKQGLTADDLKWLKLLEGQTWEGIYIPDVQASERSSTAAILKDLRNPVVRHRVEFFGKTLRDLCDWSEKNLDRKVPDRVAVELVREKLSDKKKTERDKFNRERRKERQEAISELKRVEGKHLVRKYMLAKAQGWKNLFPSSGDKRQASENIRVKDLPNYDIEHILPRTKGGPDAIWNLVLCPHSINREKKDQTPRDWLKDDPERWNLFVKRVEDATGLSAKTRQLLLSSLDEAREISDKYTQLAGTAWIARLARRVIFSTLDWPENQENGQKVTFVNGGLTAKLRRKYGLDRILNPDGEENEKNRDAPLHHALDAAVVSFVENPVNPEIPEKGLRSIRTQIESTVPFNAGPRASLLEENFYGKRKVTRKADGDDAEAETFEATIWRVPLYDLAIKLVQMKPVFKIEQLEENIARIFPTPHMQPDLPTREVLLKALDKLRVSKTPEEEWKKWCRSRMLKGWPRRVMLYERISEGLSELKEVLPAERGTPGKLAQQVLKPKGTHLGQFVVSEKDSKGKTKISVRPLYVHEVEYEVRKSILAEGKTIRFFVRSGDYLDLPEGTEDGKIEPGTYRLNTIKSRDGEVRLSTMLGAPLPAKSINILVPLGLQPVVK